MADTGVLKEFLVKIGFKVDETKFRRFQESMRITAKGALELGKSTVAASVVMGTSLKLMAQQMEGLYYASQRTGASAKNLKEFSFAASQIGVSAEQAQGAIEGLAASRRTNPGLNGVLGGLGIDPKQTDNAKVMVQLLTKLHSMPYYQGAQMAQMFGINEQSFQMLEAGLPEMQKYFALREKIFSKAGIDPGAMTAKSHEFMGHLRTLEAGIETLGDVVAYRLMPAGEKMIGWLEKAVGWLLKADKATAGWSSKLLGVASAIGGGSLLKGGLGKVAGIFGRGGGAAVAGEAEAAGGAAAAEGGAGVLGAVALPAIIIAAVGAAIVYMMTHKDQVRAVVGGAWDATKKHVSDAAKTLHEGYNKLGAGNFAKSALLGISPNAATAFDAVQHGLSKVADAAKSVASGNALAAVSNGLTQMTAKFEGFRDKVYNDVAGHATVGFGHLVKAGEDFSKGLTREAAEQLLGKDMAGAMASVKKLVTVGLSGGQMSALADFVFNLGEGKLAKSTLLKKLNGGDFAGAASEFGNWNKVMQNGHLVANAGLSKRREAEAQAFRGGNGVQISQKTDIHVTGGDPHATGAAVAREQTRVNGDLVRNFAGAVQ